MPDDYWGKDEVHDRVYYARDQENGDQRQVPSPSYFHWPTRRLRAVSLLSGMLLMIFWWTTSRSQPTNITWSRVAYSQYATDTHSLCNSLMIFESLHRLGSKADRVLLHPEEWTAESSDIDGRLLRAASQKFGVKLVPVKLLGSNEEDRGPGTFDAPDSDWVLSVTKLHTWELVQYDRVLHLDSDIMLLQHVDELFSLPKTPIAMPRAYWSDGPPSSWPLTSLIMLIEPNSYETPAMLETLRQWQTDLKYFDVDKYDMDLINHRFGGSAMVLPHRPYAMLTAEFRSQDHTKYLGSANSDVSDPRGEWNPERELKEAKLVHFSDWPLPKPWIMWPEEGLFEIQPKCDRAATCKEREIWKAFYEDFRIKREKICEILPVPAPDWAKWKKDRGAT